MRHYIVLDVFITKGICFIGDQLQKDARNWISPPDPSKNYNIACEIYQTGTGLWFFQGGVFSEWSIKGTLLWIHGKRACAVIPPVSWTDVSLRIPFLIAGSGKTLLLYVISLLLFTDFPQTQLVPRSFETSIDCAPPDWR